MCSSAKRYYSLLRKIIIACFCVSLPLLLIFFQNMTNDQDIIVLQYAEHAALDAVREGFSEHMKKCCSEYSISYENAQGDPAIVLQLAQKIYIKNPKFVVSIGTLASQAFLKKEELNVIFSSVTDPLSAGLIKTEDRPGLNFTGISNAMPIKEQVMMMKKIIPNLKKIGLLYNSGEANSNFIAQQVRDISAQVGISTYEATANSTTDMVSAAKNIARNVDIIFISNDNTALSALQGIIKTSTELGTPVFCSDVDTINLGVIAAFGPNQREIGIQTAKMLELFLKDSSLKIAETPIQYPGGFELKINKKVAGKLGITIDPAILPMANEVIE